MSLVLGEKYLPRISCQDWEHKVQQLQQICTAQRTDSFSLRNDSSRIRNNTEIETLWNTYNNNRKLADRVLEIERWRSILEQRLHSINNEIAAVDYEKCLTDNQIQSLNLNLTLVNECLTLRNERHNADLCEDIGQIELKKEHSILERVKKTLTEKSHAGWEQIKKLEEIKAKLEHDLADKNKTLDIDKTCLQLTSSSSDLSYKLDPLRSLETFSSHQTWLNHCEYLKNLSDTEIAASQKTCEAMYVPRQKTQNELFHQNEAINFALRKRIYETKKQRDELNWQNIKIKQEMERLLSEINEIEQAFEMKTNILKLAETRIEKRLFRPGIELCNDDSLTGLKQEIIDLREIRGKLSLQLDIAKTSFNEMEEKMLTLEQELADKNHALNTDTKCLNLRLLILSDQ